MEKRGSSRGSVLVIGGGVTGLTTAWVLLDHGFHVTILAKEYPSAATVTSNKKRITSQIAGALWEWPPSVCGRHKNEISLERSKKWCMVTYSRLEELSKAEDFGVRMLMCSFFFKQKVVDSEKNLKKMLELKDQVEGFRHDEEITEELQVNSAYGIVDAYQHLAPVVDTDIYLQKLLEILRSDSKCRLMRGIVHGDLLDGEESLLQKFHVDLIVNCTGLASFELANDASVYPLRGALIRIMNDGAKFPKLDQCMVVSLDGDENSSQDMIFIVPRNENTLILGGIAEPHEFDLNINMENHQALREMFDRNMDFLPCLRGAEIDPDYPIAVGLRPCREANVRLEVETRVAKNQRKSKIIHNYGHGGAGVSLSFGCSEEVASIAKFMLLKERSLQRIIDIENFNY